MPSPNSQKWLALIGLALLLAFVFQGTRGLWDPDEGRYAEVASEMLSSGDFINPRLDGQPHFTKPPLTYWCIAGSMAIFGRGEWVVRLFGSLAYALTVLVVAALGTRLWDRKTGLWAGLIYATSLTPFAGASFVTPDTLLTLWEALALYAFWRGFTAESSRDRFLWPTLTGAAFGLAFLTKGPPGLIFLPGMLLFRLLPAGRRREAAPVLNLTGLVLFAAMGLSWYGIVIAEQRGLLGYFVREEIVGRIVGHHHRNPEWYGPLVIYGPALILGSLPWCLFWPRMWRALRATSGAGASMLERRVPLFLSISTLLPIVVFSVVRSRLPLYVLPLFVPLALATARAIVALGVLPAAAPRQHLGSHAWVPRLALWTLILLGGRLSLALWPNDRDARRLYLSLPPAANAEFVVAGSRPYPGLAFYAQRDLEYVYWAGANADSATRAEHHLLITEEIAEGTQAGSHSHLYLVQETRGELLQKLLATAGANILARRRVGSLEAVLTGPPPS
jgi:4-amino-4-deoxy-L-arabinose transferase